MRRTLTKEKKFIENFGRFDVEKGDLCERYLFKDFILEVNGTSDKFEDGCRMSILSILMYPDTIDTSIEDRFYPEVQTVFFSDIVKFNEDNKTDELLNFTRYMVPRLHETLSSLVKFLPQNTVACFKKLKNITVLEAVIGLTGISSYFMVYTEDKSKNCEECLYKYLNNALKYRDYMEYSINDENNEVKKVCNEKYGVVPCKSGDFWKPMFLTIRAKKFDKRLSVLDVFGLFFNSLSLLDNFVVKKN